MWDTICSINLTRSTAKRNEQKSTLSRLFWRLSGAQHNIKNFKDTIQNYTTYKEDENIPTGINDQLDVNFMMIKILALSHKGFEVAGISMLFEVKINTFEMNGKNRCSLWNKRNYFLNGNFRAEKYINI